MYDADRVILRASGHQLQADPPGTPPRPARPGIFNEPTDVDIVVWALTDR